MGRPFCYRCHKAKSQCICEYIPVVENHMPIFILQHFRERFHPIGTARFARLGFRNCQIVVARSGLPRNSRKENSERRWDQSSLLTGMQLPKGTAVLYPSSKAIPLSLAEPPEGLLVLDATWSHAKRLYIENPWIQSLPHISIAPQKPSRYLIRKEPAQHCLSSIEAIVQTLEVLEPGLSGLDLLLQAFDKMVAMQSGFLSQCLEKKSVLHGQNKME